MSDPPLSHLIEPHRGSLLSTLSIVGAVISVFGISCIPGLGILGLPFSLIAFLGSRADLRRMDRGQMDPEGRELTESAMKIGRNGVIIAGISFITTTIVVFLLIRPILSP